MRGWPETDRVVMLQSVFTGEAQEAYSTFSAVDCQTYSTVKNAVLRAYELVPDAYRQCFRTWEKADEQTNVEFAKELSKHFNRWCSAVGVITLKDLCDLIVLEQFRDCIQEAEILADKYILARKGKLGRSSVPDMHAKNVGHAAKMSWSESAKPNRGSRSGGFDEVCNYCHERGHWKADCPSLKSRFNRGGNTFAKPAALSVPVRQLPVSNKVLDAVEPENGNFSGFGAFVSDGFVSVPGQNKVPVKILRDTGAKDSFILSSVLPLSQDTDCLLVQGMGLKTLCSCAVTRAMAAKDSETQDFAFDHEKCNCERDLHVPDSVRLPTGTYH